MSDEQNDTSVGIVAKIDTSGFSVQVRSRTVQALDFLLSGKLLKRSIADQSIIRAAAREEAMKDQLAQALSEKMVEQLGTDPALAGRATDALLSSAITEQRNKEAVLNLAIQDLAVNRAGFPGGSNF